MPSSFSYDEVQCLGTEGTLDSCRHFNVHDCGPSEGAGVVCNTGSGPTIGNILSPKIWFKITQKQIFKIFFFVLNINWNF